MINFEGLRPGHSKNTWTGGCETNAHGRYHDPTNDNGEKRAANWYANLDFQKPIIDKIAIAHVQTSGKPCVHSLPC